MIKAAVLDGWHARTVTTMHWKSPEPVLRLIRPSSVVVCGCDEESWEKRYEAHIHEYRLCGVSLDGSVGLYSREGGDLLGALSNGRDWIVKDPASRRGDSRLPLYFNCYERGAFDDCADAEADRVRKLRSGMEGA